MADVVFIQRVITHYRRDVYLRLYEQYGWVVATAERPPGDTFLKVVEDEPFLRTFPFVFPDAANPFRVRVPLGQIIDSLCPKALIAEFSMSMDSTVPLALRRLFGRPPLVVFWSHGYNMDRGFGSVRDRFIQAARARIAALGDAHLVYNEEGKNFLARYMDSRRVFVVGNSFDVLANRRRLETLPPASPSPSPELITIGRLTPDKDIVRLLRVFSRFLNRFSTAHLTIIGDGPEMPTIGTAGQSLIDRGAVTLAGEIYDEDLISRLFQGADLAVFPGAVGLSVNHALSYDVPVMAFASMPDGPKHHPEISYVKQNETGYLVSPYDDNALFEALIEVFSKGESPKVVLRPKIRLFVDRELTLDRIVKNFEPVADYLNRLKRD